MSSASINRSAQHYLPENHQSLKDAGMHLAWIESHKSSLNQQTLTHGNFLFLVASIPIVDYDSYLPLLCFSSVLERCTKPQSTFEILRYYTNFWQKLPESAKDQSGAEAGFVQYVQQQIAASIGHLPSLFSASNTSPAIIDPATKQVLSHQELSTFIRNFKLPLLTQSKKPVVILALPNGYTLGLAVLAVASYYTVAPINIGGGAKQFQNDAELVQAKAILVLEADVDKLGLRDQWVSDAGIKILIVEHEPNSTFAVRTLDPPTGSSIYHDPTPNGFGDFALILLTSGTSGKKKVVPVTTFSLLTGISCVIKSWGLTETDSCVNMMPLNHVGGLVRNLFAPVLSGGSTILCTAFDPNVFWDILENGDGTWYYASPSMHTAILAEGSFRQDTGQRAQLRLICNAAGSLLPALANRLKDSFGCTILPSYGMTECMPISTPPLDYVLDRPGTSGISCGPEIAIMDDGVTRLQPNQVGRICVRGGPTFAGYIQDTTTDAFLKGGWFDTGDLGYLDADGYLYLTGRGKEVINRGGELLSPFEIEEAITIASQRPDSVLYGRVQEVLAFSAPHDVLQEVVGVALVVRPGQTRPDLRELQTALKSTLHSSKLPVAVVYMNALPTSNHKIVRIRLGERLSFEPLTDSMKLIERHFEAECPPVNSSLDTKIRKLPCSTSIQAVMDNVSENLDAELEAFVTVQQHDGLLEVFVAPRQQPSPKVSVSDLQDALYANLRRDVDGYSVPRKITYLDNPFPKQDQGVIDEDELARVLRDIELSNSSSTTGSETEQKVCTAMAEVLGCAVDDICSDTDFFDIGGDSLSAGRLLSILRRDLQVRIPIDQLFANSQVKKLGALIDSLTSQQESSAGNVFDTSSIGSGKTHSSTNIFVLIVQLLPIMVFYPMKMGFQLTVFLHVLSIITSAWKNNHIESRFLSLIAAMAASRVATQIAAPLFAIAGKWIIIGRYKEGLYPMWGMYHTRWWIVDKLVIVCGEGVFETTAWTHLLYLRALGAKIGRGVTIATDTMLGEYDLLDIGDNVHLDRCVCRPFACEQNASMYLGKIQVGKNSTIGLKTYIAAGSVVPDDTYIGPNSSSYEMDDPIADKRGTVGMKTPSVHILTRLLVIYPIQIIVLFISSLPWMGGLFGMLKTKPHGGTDSVRSTIDWWASPSRIMYHFLAQTLNVSVRPILWFSVIVTIKFILDRIIGKAKPHSLNESTQGDRFRRALMDALLPNGNISPVTKLFGSHYEFTSMAVRAMGGRVGQRVYWPGTGPSIQDFDLVDIGDDVVFGSRSHIITSDSLGSAPVQVQSGAMIADRVVISPGTTVGRGAILGSGTLTSRDEFYADGTVWVGSKNGRAVCLSQPSGSQEKLKAKDFHNEAAMLKPEACFTREQSAEFGYELPSYQSSNFSVATTRADLLIAAGETSKFSAASSRADLLSASGQADKSSFKSSSPFGRAFYEGKASYHVLGQATIFMYCMFVTIFTVIYWNTSTVAIVMISNIMKHSSLFTIGVQRPFLIFGFATALLSGIITILSIFSLLIVIAAKWAILGRRKPGSYDWDQSSYCQRWQLFLTIEALRRRCLGGQGVLNMITGTHYIVLYFRAMGATIGKDCALFAGGRPSVIFTEPELLDLGDRVAIDDASLVSHINSRGNFSLRKLHVGSQSVLRSGSRLLSGAQMGEKSCLLEHTLIMAGDAADDGTTYQGWPANVFQGDRLNTTATRVN